jgi:hypothetical protein
MKLVVDNETIVDKAWRKLEAIGYVRPNETEQDEKE